MDGLEAVVLVGLGVLLATVLARRARVAAPLVLLAVGVALGFIPQVRQAPVPPELVLLLLPVLLYWESLTTSLREIRRNLTVIAVLATVLVAATAAAVAVAAHQLGMLWGPAWVLGAAVAPTDATATAALGRLFSTRQITILRAESLINDGTALVIYGVAVGVTTGEQTLIATGIGLQVVLAYLGGAIAGGVVAVVNAWLRRRLDDPLLGNLVMLLAPFSAYLIAELIGASGVVAVVVSGLIMSQLAPRLIRAQHRSQALAFWPLLTFIINAALFVFVGIELQQIGQTFTGAQLTAALLLVAAVSAVAIVVRLVFVAAVAAVTAATQRSRRRPGSVETGRSTLLNGLAGFRGAISLAVALSVPDVLRSGAAFPDRDLIIFVTAGAVLITLVGQAIAVQLLARNWSSDLDGDARRRERDVAIVTAFEQARAALPELATAFSISSRATDWLRQEYDTYLGDARAQIGDAHDTDVTRDRRDYIRLSLELISRRRDTVIRLRDTGVIDDTSLGDLQANLDAEELRLINPAPADG